MLLPGQEGRFPRLRQKPGYLPWDRVQMNEFLGKGEYHVGRKQDTLARGAPAFLNCCVISGYNLNLGWKGAFPSMEERQEGT